MENSTHLPVTDELALETVFSLLSDRHRRSVVEILSERESSMPLDDVAAAVAAAKTEAGSDRAPSDIRDVAATLHHVHLPKLDEADVIDYDPERNAVTPVRAEAVAPFVRVVETDL